MSDNLCEIVVESARQRLGLAPLDAGMKKLQPRTWNKRYYKKALKALHGNLIADYEERWREVLDLPDEPVESISIDGIIFVDPIEDEMAAELNEEENLKEEKQPEEEELEGEEAVGKEPEAKETESEELQQPQQEQEPEHQKDDARALAKKLRSKIKMHYRKVFPKKPKVDNPAKDFFCRDQFEGLGDSGPFIHLVKRMPNPIEPTLLTAESSPNEFVKDLQALEMALLLAVQVYGSMRKLSCMIVVREGLRKNCEVLFEQLGNEASSCAKLFPALYSLTVSGLLTLLYLAEEEEDVGVVKIAVRKLNLAPPSKALLKDEILS